MVGDRVSRKTFKIFKTFMGTEISVLREFFLLICSTSSGQKSGEQCAALRRGRGGQAGPASEEIRCLRKPFCPGHSEVVSTYSAERVQHLQVGLPFENFQIFEFSLILIHSFDPQQLKADRSDRHHQLAAAGGRRHGLIRLVQRQSNRRSPVGVQRARPDQGACLSVVV